MPGGLKLRALRVLRGKKIEMGFVLNITMIEHLLYPAVGFVFAGGAEVHGQAVELVDLFAEAHQAIDLKAMLQAEQMAGFVDGGLGAALEHELPVGVLQAVDRNDPNPAAQLGFAVHISQNRDADIPGGDGHLEWGTTSVGRQGLDDPGCVVLIAHGHIGIFGQRLRRPDVGE